MGLVCANTRTGDAAEQRVPARAPPIYSLLRRRPLLFHKPTCSPFLMFHFYYPSMYVEDSSIDSMSYMYMMCVCVCVYVCACGSYRNRYGWWIHRWSWHQNRVHCKHSAAKSSAKLHRAQLEDAEVPITFTEGGLDGFLCVLSPPGCLAMGFPSLGASVCTVRDRNTERERKKKQTEINGLAHHHWLSCSFAFMFRV